MELPCLVMCPNRRRFPLDSSSGTSPQIARHLLATSQSARPADNQHEGQCGQSTDSGDASSVVAAPGIFRLPARPPVSVPQQLIVQALRHHGIAGGLVYLNPTEPFNLYLYVALVGGLFVASPFVFYQLWLFIAPGLYRKERRYVLPFLLSTVGLFIAGGLFGYKLVYPASLDFLIGYGQRFQPMITIGEYTRLFVTIIVGLGLIFELPILVFFLAVMRVVTARWMWRNLRYSILVIFTVAAVVTPTADVLNMCLFAAPMLALYAISIGVAWLVNSRRQRKHSPI